MNMTLQFDLTKWFLMITGHFMSVNVLQASLEDITVVGGGTAPHLFQFLLDFHDFLHILSVEWS